jgi:hypothetical protein
MSNYVSYCGLYCGACLCNIARETDSMEEFAKKTGRTVEQLTCPDCKVAKHQDCCFVTCCEAKGIDNCSECDEMPCESLTKFASDESKYHSTTIPNLKRIKEIGIEAWLKEQKLEFTCPQCGARTGWMFKNCTKCSCEIHK